MKQFLLSFFIFFCFSVNIFAQQNGNLAGNVTDVSTGQSLPGASVFIEGKTIGTSTDIDGNYRLMNIPAGSYTIVFQFIGYVALKQQIEILAGTTSKLDAALTADAFGLDEVVVTAQMLGQAKAINQQLNSDAMVNVVSSDKIKELPDINAAEAIGRLPGVSLIRSGGEASKVVLRGLNPSLTSVTINGVRVPSSSANDRSVDLSMISPDLLSNIEVFKSATADMDGDAIGGIVNLGVTKAAPNPQANFRLYSGYNGLKNELGKNYKGTADVSKRFFNQKLGILAKANYEQINRSFESVGMSYDTDDTTQFLVDNLSLTNNTTILQRLGSELQLDYQYKSGFVVAQGFYSKRSNDSENWNNDIENGKTVGHTPSHSKSDMDTWQAMLNGKQNLRWMEIDWVLARSNTKTDNYYNVRLQIVEADGVEQTAAPKTPQELFAKRKYNYQSAWIHRYNFEPALNDQKNNTAAVNFKIDYNLGSKIGGFIKFGAKYKTEERERTVNHQIQNWYYLQSQARAKAVELWPYPMVLGGNTGNMLMIDNFYSGAAPLSIWNGEYSIQPNIDMNILDEWHTYQQSTLIKQYDKTYLDYTVNEKVTAGYVMAKLNYSNWLTFIPGLRYEYSDNAYGGIISSLDFTGVFGNAIDTTTYQQYGELLPSFHLKIMPVDWMDIRFSAVKTLARPNYNMVTPRANIDISNGNISRGNPQLKHAEAWSYDGLVSFFTNKFGLFTVGGFYKAFDNYFTNTQRVMSPEEAASLGYPATEYNVREDYVNFDKSKVYGFEIDMQTSFSYLPKPFNGLILNFNLTRLYSETYQPLFTKVLKNIGTTTRPKWAVDYENSYWTYTKTALPDQVKWISNASIGYDYKGFSSRVSAAYQARYLTNLSSAGEGGRVIYESRYSDNFLRFDASISQKLGKYVMLMANLANFTGESERNYQYLPKYPRNENRYGATFDIGIQIKL
jgi:TonB-dependent receptor